MAPETSLCQGVWRPPLIPLLPPGAGLFQGKRLDIISEGEYIPADTPVKIIHMEGNRLVVRRESRNQHDQEANNREGVR